MPYMERVIRAGTELERGTVKHAEVKHDDWCAIFQGGACDCEPTITLHDEWPPAENKRGFTRSSE